MLFVTTQAVLAAAGSDTVNERIPVRKAEMEAHWKVDCRALWQALTTALPAASGRESCGVTPDLRQQLQLCAFIHQPPGEESTHSCPDYRGLLLELESPLSSDACVKLATSVLDQTNCAARPPA